MGAGINQIQDNGVAAEGVAQLLEYANPLLDSHSHRQYK